MNVAVIFTLLCSCCHLICGLTSMCLGVVACARADIWLAHIVSPIWSGAFFFLTGILGLACVSKRTSYTIMCFAALSVVSLVTVVVSIQLLRLGLVNETTDGHTFQKENKDNVIVVALTVTSLEGVFCVISAFISCRLASKAKKELQSKREGTFHVRIMGEKDIVLVSKQAPDGTEKREKVFATSI